MIYAFGDYELDTRRDELRHAGVPCKIEPQVFKVLTYLVQHHDRTVTRQELFDRLWPGQFISDSVLSYCIMEARKAVGDSGRTQQVVKTLHGRGFRFVAEVQEGERDLLDAVPTPTVPPSAPDVDLKQGQRLVTVLCAALADTAALHKRLGFDALQRLRQAFFGLAQEGMRRYGGVLQFYGADGILVLFGAAEACQEHARQAVRASLELQRHLRELPAGSEGAQPTEAAVRMAVATGAIEEDSISTDQRIASADLGEPGTMAVWLQYLTEPGTLCISDSTMRLVQTEIRQAVPRALQVPGQPQPFRVYLL